MGQELPKVPCVYCGHGNLPGHRFCGMCGKALPDLVKQTKPVAASGSAIVGGGIGAASRSSTPTSAPPVIPPAVPPVVPSAVAPSSAPIRRASPAARAENPNRDLSYLLHDDDHEPPKTNRVPFILAGLILAAVAGFFYLRGSGKPKPDGGAATSDATASQATSSQGTPPASTDGTPSEAKADPPKGETPKAEASKTETAAAEPGKTEPAAGVPKTEPEKAEIPVIPTPAPVAPAPAASAPVKDTHRPAPAVATTHPKPAARPAPQQKKPSPGKVAPETETAAAEDAPEAPTDNCEAQLPAMRKAAARGDAKAKADLGLVYYAGRCVARDLPTAYHWYALALRTAPDSPQISAQLEAIWKQMSPAERQLALKAQ